MKDRSLCWLVVAVVTLFFGCFTPRSSDEVDSLFFTVLIDSGGTTGFRAALPDGTVFTDPELYSEQAPAMIDLLNVEQLPVTLKFGESVVAELDKVFGSEPEDEGGGTAVGGIGSVQQAATWNQSLPSGYHLSVSVDGTKWINGCMKRYTSPGGAIRLHRNGVQLWNMHVGHYLDESLRTCFGAYESVSGWTRCTCMPTFSDIKNTLYTAALAAGFTASVAWLIAEAGAPILVVGLAF